MFNFFTHKRIFAQASRFVCQVTMKPYSTNRNIIKTETANPDNNSIELKLK